MSTHIEMRNKASLLCSNTHRLPWNGKKKKKNGKQTDTPLVAAAAPTSSSSSGFKVALLGAGGGIGQPLGLLLKL